MEVREMRKCEKVVKERRHALLCLRFSSLILSDLLQKERMELRENVIR